MDVVATRDLDNYPEIGEAFATIMGVSFVLSLASVLVSLVLFVQINNLFRDNDIQWFIRETQDYHFLPSKLLMAAIATMVVGHVLMVLLLHKRVAAWIVGIVSTIMIGFCYWFYESSRMKVDSRLCQLVSNVEELRMVFGMIDTSKRNKVTVETMKAKLRNKTIQNYIQVSEDRVNDVVAQIDADGDGWVTWTEFRDHLSNKRVSDAFQSMDINGDGVISNDEFSKFYLGADEDDDGVVTDHEMQNFLARTTPRAD